MYRVNPLERFTLITTDEVLFHAQTKQTIDPRMIEQNIIIAEERFIRPEFGYAFYEDLLAKKNVIVDDSNRATLQAKMPTVTPAIVLVNGNIVNAFELLPNPAYIQFWKNHLWKLIAECVITTAFPEGFVQFGTEGAFHNSPPAGLMVTSGQVTPLITSMKWTIDTKLKDRIVPLIQSAKMYLCKYRGNFAFYDCKGCPEDEDTKAKNTKFTGLALDIYDDHWDEDWRSRRRRPPG